MKTSTSDDYSKTVRKHTAKVVIACAFCWGISIFVLLIGAFIFLTEAIGIIVAALLGAFLLLLPVFKFKLLQLGSFEGTVTDIDCRRRYKLYMIKPGVGEHAVQNRTEYTLYVQKDNGKTATLTYVEKEDHELPYQKGDRVRYRWGVPYMQILAMEEAHSTLCPFYAHEMPAASTKCQMCRKPLSEEDARSEESI